jgi:hypothetical protein
VVEIMRLGQSFNLFKRVISFGLKLLLLQLFVTKVKGVLVAIGSV